jgi:hypothetical protein
MKKSKDKPFVVRPRLKPGECLSIKKDTSLQLFYLEPIDVSIPVSSGDKLFVVDSYAGRFSGYILSDSENKLLVASDSWLDAFYKTAWDLSR